MTMRHWMLCATLVLAVFARATLVAQAPTPVPADPPPPPLIPAADPAPVTAPPPAAPAKATEKKAAPKKAPAKASTKPAAAKSGKASEPAPTRDLKPGEAVVTEKNVNVRGQPALNSEIVTHLKRGDVVTVLGQTNLSKHGPDEPAQWARIALPSGTPLWVNAGFVENGKVKPKRLNLRSGPGENYSIAGRVDKGTALREIEKKGDWIKIEAPEGSYAFVWTALLSQDPSHLAAVAKTKAPPATTTTTIAVKPVETVAVNPQPTVVLAAPSTPAAPVTPAPSPAPAPSVAVTTPSTTAPPPPPAAPEPPPSAPASALVPVPAGELEPLVKRIVTREGIVRGSASIQAPTYFVLRSLDNNKTINYLHSIDTNIVLRAFQHQRVMVVGEEILDERWPNTPVIDVESIEAVP